MTAGGMDPTGPMPGSSHPSHLAEIGPWWLPLLLVVPAAGAYAVGVVRLTRRGDRWPAVRSLLAAAGFASLTTSLLPPLVDTMDLRVHVTQHLLLAMAAPLLLALSAPITLALRTTPAAGRRRLLAVLHSRFARALTFAPLVLLLEVGGLYAYYLTPLFGETRRQPWLHAAVHTHMFLAGCLLSWYLVGRDPLPRRPSTRTALIVLVTAAGSHDLLAKLMYAHALPHGAGTIAQLRAGSQLMFYGGDVIDVALACTLMFTWYARAGRELDRRKRRATSSVRGRPGAPAAVRAAS